MLTLFFSDGPGAVVGRRRASDTKRFARVPRGAARARRLLAAVAVRGGVPERRAHSDDDIARTIEVATHAFESIR